MAPSYHVAWDVATNRPIVDGKIETGTGAIEPAGDVHWFGPPAIDLTWWNKTRLVDFRGSRSPCFLTLEQLLDNTAVLFQIIPMPLVSMTATPYYVYILIEAGSDLTTMDEIMSVSRGFEKSKRTTTAAHDTLPQSSIHAIWHNINANFDLRIIEKTLLSDAARLFIQVVEHMRAGLYDIESLNISGSSLMVVIKAKRDLHELEDALTRIPSAS